MDEYSGFILIIDEARRANLVRDNIERDGTFTDTISSSDWRARSAEIFMLSLDGMAIQFACLARRGRNKVATLKYVIRFSNFIEFDPEISLQEIQTQIPSSIRQHFIRSSSGLGSHVPHKTWESILLAIKQLRPTSADALDRLDALRRLRPETLNRPGGEVVIQERDAINLALRMSGFDPIELLDWKSPDTDLAPFLTGLTTATTTEDQMIAHDAEVFGDWNKISRYQVGASVFQKRGERLTIMNVNRHAVEHSVGVDLVYYFHRYEAYIMVQYKRMLRESEEMMYRLNDNSYKEELKRMNELETLFTNEPSQATLSNFRMHRGSFYFKLCPAEINDITSTDMIHGMYVPLDYWNLLVNSDSIIGPQGGRRITFENVGRYFNNTIFIELVQAGWFGSRVSQTNIITDIISRSIENNKSVILASLVETRRKR